MAKKYLTLSGTLKKLLFERNMKAVDLAREIKMTPPTIHRLITGKSTRPHQSSLKPIADYFSISIEQLLGEAPTSTDTQTEIKENQLRTIPIVKWSQPLENATSISTNKRIAASSEINNEAFALIMPDTSMEPLFQLGSILIFDPKLKAHDRSYILVKLHESKSYVFRQLLVDVSQKYIKPLNPDLSAFRMRLLDKDDDIIACLVESRFNFQSLGENINLEEI